MAMLDRLLDHRVDEPELPKDIRALELLQMAYRGEIELSPQQFNAAKVCLEYEQPKLSAVAIGHMDGTSFAAALERCLKRSAATYEPRPALPPPPEHPASEVRKPFNFPRRNFR